MSELGMVFIQVEVLGFEWINMISHKYYVKRQYSNCELDFVPDKTINRNHIGHMKFWYLIN